MIISVLSQYFGVHQLIGSRLELFNAFCVGAKCLSYITRSNSLLEASQLYLAKHFGHSVVLQAIALTLNGIVVKTYQINGEAYN